jgi:hypothetical protein
MRKQKQKAAKRQTAQGDATGHAQQQQQPHGGRAQQQSSGRGAQQPAGAGPRKSAEATAMAEAIAFVTAAATQQPAQSRLARSAFWQGKTWQVIVPVGTVAAGLDDATLGEALASARDEQRRQQLLNVPQAVPQAQRSAFGAPAFAPSATPIFGAPAKSPAQGQFSGFGRR